MRVEKKRTDAVASKSAKFESSNEDAMTAEEIADNLEMNLAAVEEYLNSAKGIANFVLNDGRLQPYTDKGFSFKYEDKDSSTGDLYYNIVIYDDEKANEKKNEVKRICILKAKDGVAEINKNFTNIFWNIEYAIYKYIVEKRINYFNKKTDAVAESNTDKYREKIAALRANAA